jgi:hypothetical protein
VASPAAGVDFDRNRLSQGELIAGIAGVVLLIDLWFSWYGITVSAGGGFLNRFSIGASANAWESFGVIDIILFLVALIAIGVAVLRALDRLPEMPYPPGALLTVAGAVALLLIVFRIIDPPIDTQGIQGIDVSRKIGVWLGLLAAAAITYGGWRAMQEAGVSVGGLAAGMGGGAAAAGTAAATNPTAPTTPMPAADPGAPGEEGGEAAPPPVNADPVPGEPAGETPPGLTGETPADGGTPTPGP